MKDKVIRKESKSQIITKKQEEKNKSKFTITIIDNETKEVLLNEKTNAILGCVNIPNKATETSTAIQQFCSTACNTQVLLNCLKNLDNLQRNIVSTMLKEMGNILED